MIGKGQSSGHRLAIDKVRVGVIAEEYHPKVIEWTMPETGEYVLKVWAYTLAFKEILYPVGFLKVNCPAPITKVLLYGHAYITMGSFMWDKGSSS